MIDFLSVSAVSYLIGSIPTGFVVTRTVVGTDIRTFGSGGTGATNVQRVLGWRWGLAIALADIAKGIVAVLTARAITDSEMVVALGASLAIVGHCWPVWLRFRGGKGVATGAGAAFALSPWGLLLIPILVVPVLMTRFVSLGSVIAACSAPVLFAAFALAGVAPTEYVAFGVVAACVIVSKHRSNIERLRAGTERRIGRTRGTARVA